MLRSSIPTELRRLVTERAQEICEYCLLHTLDAILPHQIDHVIAIKHGGPMVSWNLALSCVECNLRKGTDLATIDWETGRLIPLFNPRQQCWSDHFVLDGARINGMTPTGIGTVSLLQLNRDERLRFRQVLFEEGLYPSSAIFQS